MQLKDEIQALNEKNLRWFSKLEQEIETNAVNAQNLKFRITELENENGQLKSQIDGTPSVSNESIVKRNKILELQLHEKVK